MNTKYCDYSSATEWSCNFLPTNGKSFCRKHLDFMSHRNLRIIDGKCIFSHFSGVFNCNEDSIKDKKYCINHYIPKFGEQQLLQKQKKQKKRPLEETEEGEVDDSFRYFDPKADMKISRLTYLVKDLEKEKSDLSSQLQSNKVLLVHQSQRIDNLSKMLHDTKNVTMSAIEKAEASIKISKEQAKEIITKNSELTQNQHVLLVKEQIIINLKKDLAAKNHQINGLHKLRHRS